METLSENQFKVRTRNLFLISSQINFEWHRMKDGKIQGSFKIQPIDWCAYMSGTSKKINPFIKMIIDSIKAASPDYFHTCPYFGAHSMMNVTALKPFVTLSPSGAYRLIVKITEKILLWGLVLDYELI
jgi:hypothetical protein